MASPAIIWRDVVAVAPEASAASGDTANAILAAVALEVDDRADGWGPFAFRVATLLAAHLAVISRSRGKGPITAQGEDRLSRSYKDLMSFGLLGQSSYGAEVLRLARQRPAALGAVF